MDETKKYIIGMVIGVLAQIQNKAYQLYKPKDSKLFDEHKVEATADMISVPSEYLKQHKWVHDHELAMALVTSIRNNYSHYGELLLKGSPPFFDLWIDGDRCGITILTRKA